MKVRLKESATTTLESISKNKIYDVHIDSMTRYFVFDDNNNRYYYDTNIWDVISDVPDFVVSSISGTQYVCPMDLYDGHIKKGDIVYYVDESCGECCANGDESDTHYLPPEWVNTWEKVEEDIFVNGVKVKFDELGANFIFGISFNRQELEILRDLPRETYDKIIARLG